MVDIILSTDTNMLELMIGGEMTSYWEKNGRERETRGGRVKAQDKKTKEGRR